MPESASSSLLPLSSSLASPLVGTAVVPGDKSISHRALLLSSQVLGTTTIHGLLEGEDVIRTAKALQCLGVSIQRLSDTKAEECKRSRGGHIWVVKGVGVGGLKESDQVLDMGNSGTGARLMMGLVAPYPYVTVFTGDHSLVKRPMGRVTRPLERVGIKVMGRSEARLPLALQGSTAPKPINYRLPLPSAQVKSAMILAGLNIAGTTTVIEPEATRDHTEVMLQYLGFKLTRETLPDGALAITMEGQQQVPANDRELTVPGDPSSAAFLIVAALLVPGSELTLPNICLNPTRIGLFTTLIEMGGDIQYLNRRTVGGEEVADLLVKSSKLKGITVPAERAPVMIDEYPILAIAAATAKGPTKMQGLAELRVKESDRLSAIAEGLKATGIKAEIDGDNLTVHGVNGAPMGGGEPVVTHYDHRIAMSFLIMGMVSQKPVRIDDARAIGTSFPNFTAMMNRLGSHIIPADMLHSKRFRPLVIAIDGPAASGKGTLARRISTYCGYPYLDTGSLYRMVAMKMLQDGLDVHDTEAAIETAQNLHDLDFSDPRLRREEVGQAASVVSAIPAVRDALLDFQRNFAARNEGAVLDGRDIGTVVCPDADVKFFVTATMEARARRRFRELAGQGIDADFDAVLSDLKDRDDRDSKRTVAALIAADDAIRIETSELSAREAFEKVLHHIETKNAEK